MLNIHPFHSLAASIFMWALIKFNRNADLDYSGIYLKNKPKSQGILKPIYALYLLAAFSRSEIPVVIYNLLCFHSFVK
jgi:hypothetical protein